MRDVQEYTILDAKAATGEGKSIYCGDHRHAIITIDTDGGGNANMTVKIQGSDGKSVDDPYSAPDFGSAQSVTNQWDYLQIVDQNTGVAIDGDTGWSVSGADDHRRFAVNVDGVKWITANVTARSAGAVTVRITLFND